MVDLIVKPKARQVVVIVQDGRRIGFCVACRTPDGQVVKLQDGLADGSDLSVGAFKLALVESDMYFRDVYPEAKIAWLISLAGGDLQTQARQIATRMVTV